MNNQTTTNSSQISTFEANAQASGVLDADGFFAQDDWEFELDTLQDRSVSALIEHMASAPVEHETVAFLKGFLTGGRTHFTAFN